MEPTTRSPETENFFRTTGARLRTEDRQPRPVAAFLADIHQQLASGQILTASQLVRDAMDEHPEHEEILKLHQILRRGGSRTVPRSGRSMRLEYAWLDNPPEKYHGQWVALVGKEVVGSAATLKSLLAMLPPDLSQTPLTVRVAP